ncbi:diphthine synthase [Candidatus Pacearchaeota archaeon]|nr:diphthine synthase [Candidatus Pacearchaeota archaeon]
MAFYLTGLGLNENSLTEEAIAAIKECDKVYLENYTVNFPYNTKMLEKKISKKIVELNREQVEKEEFLLEAKKADIALLVYGSPLSATTHYSLINRCIMKGIKYKIIYNGSIMDAVAETGLQLYKFGKTTSMPKWITDKVDRGRKYEPDSFAEIIKDNQKIKAHTLILVDIGTDFGEAVKQLMRVLKNNNIKTDGIIACSRLGTNESRMICSSIEKLVKINDIKAPFCFIIPSGKKHFAEEEAIERFRI